MSFKESSDVVVDVKDVWKRYHLKAQQGSLRDALGQAVRGIFHRQRADSAENELWALQNIEFELKRGEALGIMGPNGAGKTTILKILSRVTRPTRGSVQINGRLGALLELGAGFHPDLTGRENVFLYGSILGLRQQEISNRFDEIVNFSGLERFIDVPVKRYSSGMYVRLGFSVAAHTSPEVLLIDEVLAVGDAEFRQKCIQRIKALRENGVSIIFISHNLAQVRAVCERGIFLKKGEIQKIGHVDDTINAYEQWLQTGERLQNQPGKFDFGTVRTGTDLKILGIEIQSANQQANGCFTALEEVEIAVHYYAQRDFQDLNFMLRIVRSDGLICAVIRSSDLGAQINRLSGRGTVLVRLSELRLTKGFYLIDAFIRDNSDSVTLSRGASASFEILGQSLASGVDLGVFLPAVKSVHLTNSHHAPMELILNREPGTHTET